MVQLCLEVGYEGEFEMMQVTCVRKVWGESHTRRVELPAQRKRAMGENGSARAPVLVVVGGGLGLPAPAAAPDGAQAPLSGRKRELQVASGWLS